MVGQPMASSTMSHAPALPMGPPFSHAAEEEHAHEQQDQSGSQGHHLHQTLPFA
jgi:hypothetical protein